MRVGEQRTSSNAGVGVGRRDWIRGCDSVRDFKADPPLKLASPSEGVVRTGLAQGGAGPTSPLDVQQIFEAYFDFVWRSLRRLGVRDADVDDALQEVFVVVHRKRAEFEGRARLTTWLYGICFRVASDQRRRAHVRREVPSAEPEGSEASDDRSVDPEQQLGRVEARALLDEALEALDLEKRAVFVLYEIEELPVDEIAARTGVVEGTVYSRLRAARVEFDRAVTRIRARIAGAERRVR